MKWFDLAWRLGQLSIGRLARQLDAWRWQLFQALICLLLASVCGLAVLLLMAALAWMLWGEAHRLEVLTGLLLLYTLLGLWLVRRAARWLGVAALPARGGSCPSGRRRASCDAEGGCAAR